MPQNNIVATGVVGPIVLLQNLPVKKNYFENRLSFDRIMATSLLRRFCGPQCIGTYMYVCSRQMRSVDKCTYAAYNKAVTLYLDILYIFV